MKFIILFIFLFSNILLLSCSKENLQKSEIKEKSLNLQVLEAYKEGKESLESGDVLFAAKNLMKLKYCSLNQNGLLGLP